jgi:hypothetical protein
VNDNALIIAIRTALLARLTARGITVPVKQNYQPTQQGVPSAACIFMHKLFDLRVGHPQRKDVWNPTTEVFDHVESVWIESTFQFSALAPQDPANDAELTAADILKAAAFAVQSDKFLEDLRAAGVGVLRVQRVPTGYSVDDRGQFEAEPSFDVVFTHRDTVVDVVKAVNSREIVINRV